jgi:hypothetical protein
MSNSAFALSPIAARAASPTEADFEAIREAFVETARGRWFLDEYTKRNRNADTSLVLDAVARIERTLAAQKEWKAEELKVEEPQAPSGPDLTETLIAVKAIIAAAKQNAEAALSGPPMDEALAPSRKCARVIREIAWGLREAGADGRICALLESQVEAINAACDRIPTSGFRGDVLGAFDLAAEQIDQFGASGVAPAEARQPRTETVVEDTRNVSSNVSGETQNAASNVSNDNHEAAFSAAVVEIESAAAVLELEPLPVTASSVQSEDMASGDMAPEEMASKQIASEDTASVALDESLFDLTEASNTQASGDADSADASIAVQEEASVETLELSAPADVTVEAAAAPEAALESMPAAEPVSEAAPEQDHSIAPFIASGDSAVVPQIVESLEAMADIVIEDAATDETLAEQETAAETMAVAVQDELSPDIAPQIAAMPEEAPGLAPDAEVAATASDAEADVASDMTATTPSEEISTTTLDETPGTPAKTPLPDNMLSHVSMVAQDSYSIGAMQAYTAVEATPALVAEHMMGPATASMQDAITPPVSLGASLIASGIVSQPETPRSDPLAGIRRMSHAERIAFFS